MPAQQETTLTTVVAERLLLVPDYQRPYAWEHKQLEDLWEDLDLMGPRGQHYFGTLVLRDVRDDDGEVLTSLDESGSTLRHSELVDGQQRLITCAVLLDRVRRRLVELAEEGLDNASAMADNLKRAYGTVTIDNASVPRLRLGTDLNEYWVNVVLGEETYAGGPLLGGQECLAKAVSFFDERLEGLAAGVDATGFLQRLRELQRRVTAGLRVLVYEVATSAEVGVIFETLNERGRPLSELEKTKNYLLYLARQIPDGRQDELADFINARWSAIFASLAGQDDGMDDQLLRVHWLATEDPDRRSWRRVASIKKRFDRGLYVSDSARLIPSAESAAGTATSFDRLFEEVKSYVTTLQHCSYFLAEMFDPHASFESFGASGPRVRNASAALARSGVVALFRPLLCAARLAYPVDGEFYADLVELLERYSARAFVICQRRNNAGEARLASLANALYARTYTQTEVLASVSALLWRYAPDARVRASLEGETENWYARRGHKYFLYEYELSRMGAGEQIPEFGYFTKKGNEQRTTEHILPQTPDSDAACWWDIFTPEQHAALRHALGNLVLTLDNSRYSNKCFDQKRGIPLAPGATPTACYAQASLHQERDLAAFNDWTPESIRQRQEQLTDWAMKRWHVESPDISVVEPEEAEIEIEWETEEY